MGAGVGHRRSATIVSGPEEPGAGAGPPPQWAPPSPPPWQPQWPPSPQWPPGGAGSAGNGSHPPQRPPGPVPEGARFLDVPGAPPANRPSAWLWLLYAALGFAVGEIFGSILVVIAAVGEGHFHDLAHYTDLAEQPLWVLAPGLVGLWVGLFGAAFVSSKARGTGSLARDLGVRFRWVDLWGIGIGAGAQFLIDLGYWPLVHYHIVHNLTGPAKKLLGGTTGWEFAVVAVLTVCGAPFFEELFFRGVLLRALGRLFTPTLPGPSVRRAWGLVAAVVVDGALFGLAHWEPVQFVGLALFGSVLAVVSYKTGRLGMNMVAHATFNLVAVIAMVATSGVIHH